MQRDELAAWLRLTLTPGVGNISARKLLATFGLPQAIFDQPTAALKQVVNSTQVQALCTEPQELAALVDLTWVWLQQSPANGPRRQIATLGDPLYPQALLNLDDPPLLLYLLGNASYKPNKPPDLIDKALTATFNIANRQTIDTQSSLAIVGSRNPTPQGAANARLFAKSFAQAGLTVVSGLALGIDGAAHQGALDGVSDSHAAVTVAVVGTGLDRVYPKAHHDLAHRIAEHGLLISEYALGTPPLTANFPKRNRLIAGLAQGTLVVEAAIKSGSLITARLTCEQGHEVFAIPGSIHAAQSRGCHALIKQGAKLVESAQDVLGELTWPTKLSKTTESIAASAYAERAEGIFGNDDQLLKALGFDPVGLEAMQARTGLETAQLQAQLMGLELDGLVARLPGGLFQRLSA
ncbi:DNA-processing protein DprA [Rhodoferax antarcticus]|uniref:DNA-processing protein DprA n=1 Tax=Rhodoferax antarcticus TaxID=81479 RepID=UPI00222459D3|nr:DNA-processing protein DprA [Rhodoferax antarcticus]MCW2312247.1 DNA processing protein [Rhodoferax antarcticus]